MIVDIRDDVPELLEYVRRRVDEHLTTAAKVKDLPPVKIIEFGFEFGQANWVALVFDTRPNAERDGEWTCEIDDVMLPRPRWPIWHELPEDAHVYFIDIAGKKVDVMGNPDEIICNIVGEAIKHMLLTARVAGQRQSVAMPNSSVRGLRPIVTRIFVAAISASPPPLWTTLSPFFEFLLNILAAWYASTMLTTTIISGQTSLNTHSMASTRPCRVPVVDRIRTTSLNGLTRR